MHYLLAFVFPPAAVLLCGKPVQAFFSIFLTLLCWVPGVVFALLVVSSHQADRRTARLIKALERAERLSLGPARD